MKQHNPENMQKKTNPLTEKTKTNPQNNHTNTETVISVYYKNIEHTIKNFKI